MSTNTTPSPTHAIEVPRASRGLATTRPRTCAAGRALHKPYSAVELAEHRRPTRSGLFGKASSNVHEQLTPPGRVAAVRATPLPGGLRRAPTIAPGPRASARRAEHGGFDAVRRRLRPSRPRRDTLAAGAGCQRDARPGAGFTRRQRARSRRQDPHRRSRLLRMSAVRCPSEHAPPSSAPHCTSTKGSTLDLHPPPRVIRRRGHWAAMLCHRLVVRPLHGGAPSRASKARAIGRPTTSTWVRRGRGARRCQGFGPRLPPQDPRSESCPQARPSRRPCS